MWHAALEIAIVTSSLSAQQSQKTLLSEVREYEVHQDQAVSSFGCIVGIEYHGC